MRPLNLVIEGFGTYCNRTQINLEQLGTQGLYLITGDTGSGKTTIFDAITYALYGTVNGHNRSVSMIRSTFATPDIPTTVELTFEYRGKIYKVQRNPEYERKSLRGNSITKQLADAVLYMSDGTVVSGQSKVTAAIEELLGIDFEQFSQIVMIAQGDFQQLLMEGTERRQEIFRKIFKTDYYKELQQRLLDEEKSLGIKCRDIKKELGIYIAGISCGDTSTFNIELDKAKNGELAVADEIDLISKIIDEDMVCEKALEQSISELEKNQNNIRAELTKEEQLQKLREDYEQKCGQFEKVKETIGQAKNDFENQKKREKDRSKKQEELAVLKEELKQYESFENLCSEIEVIKNQNDEFDKQLKVLTEKAETFVQKKENLTAKLKTFDDTEQKFYEASGIQKELDEKKNAFEQLENSAQSCEQLLKQYEQLKVEYKTAEEEYENADSNYKTLRKTYMNEQAGIIAQELEEGKPCPVCGSLEHPSPAKKSQTAPSKEELDSAEQNVKELEKTASAVNAECAKSKAEYENELKNIAASYLKLTKEQEQELAVLKEKILEQKKLVEQKLEQADKQLSLQEERIEQKKKIQEELPELEKLSEQMNEDQQNINAQIVALKTRLEEKTKQKDELKSKLKFENQAAAVQAVEALENEITELKKAFEQAQEHYESIQNEFTTLEGQIEQLKKQLEGAQKIDTKAFEENLASLEQQRTQATEQKGFVDTRLNKNTEALKNIKERSNVLGNLEKEYAYVSALSKTANGNLSNGKEKIKLETYIQMTYFDRIIAHANKRLMIMSDLQYELVRKKQADNLRSITGLELDVIDHYNGGQRSVKSLSGGEAFQASLSLALGLSDEVRLSAGGIKIDSMFVDEGFGTLDSEALQKAFKALSEITEGNRLVGIISHVDLLKEKIDRQIVVKKDRTGGSTVKVMV